MRRTDILSLFKSMFAPHWVAVEKVDMIPKDAKCFIRIFELACILQCREEYMMRLHECLEAGLDSCGDDSRIMIIKFVFFVQFAFPNFHPEIMKKFYKQCVCLAAELSGWGLELEFVLDFISKVQYSQSGKM